MRSVSTVQIIHCPSCGGSDVRESHSHNLADALLGMFGLVAYRCRACRNRFHKRPPPGTGEEDLEEQDAENGARGSDSR